jgi:very-short-patch-repair endonuclease
MTPSPHPLEGRQIKRWTQIGWLHRRHEGVFSVGHRAWTPQARRRAAVLAGGEGAALSHVAAAVHHSLLRWELDEIDVMVRRSGERDREGIRFHRPRVLGLDDVVEVDGILCTTAARTLVDLAGVVKPWHLERAIQRAEFLGLLDLKDVAAVLARIRRPRGVRHLRRLLTADGLAGAALESDLERRYAALICDPRVETPREQVTFRLGPSWRIRVDFHWPRHGLIVEVDGPHHSLPIFAAADARRDARLAEMGLRVQRFTEVDVDGAPDATLATTLALTSSRAD